jgi:hypothetical protein
VFDIREVRVVQLMGAKTDGGVPHPLEVPADLLGLFQMSSVR